MGIGDKKLAAVLATATVAALTVAWYRTKNQRKQSAGRRDDDYDDDYDDEIDPELWQAFQQAAGKMREKEFTSKLRLTQGDQLLLYALFKQVTVGNAPDTIPPITSWNIVAEQAKYTSWRKLQGMSKSTAALQYMTAVEHFESTLDWEGDDDDDDAQKDDSGMGPVAVSRPEVISNEHDNYDDVLVDGNATADSQLLRAASENNVPAIHELLKKVDNHASIVNNADPTGQTALHLAADKGCFEAVQVLVRDYKANVAAADQDGISVLQAAVIAGNIEICKWLLENTDVNPDQEDSDGDTPRQCAQECDDAMKALFEKYKKKGNLEANASTEYSDKDQDDFSLNSQKEEGDDNKNKKKTDGSSAKPLTVDTTTETAAGTDTEPKPYESPKFPLEL